MILCVNDLEKSILTQACGVPEDCVMTANDIQLMHQTRTATIPLASLASRFVRNRKPAFDEIAAATSAMINDPEGICAAIGYREKQAVVRERFMKVVTNWKLSGVAKNKRFFTRIRYSLQLMSNPADRLEQGVSIQVGAMPISEVGLEKVRVVHDFEESDIYGLAKVKQLKVEGLVEMVPGDPIVMTVWRTKEVALYKTSEASKLVFETQKAALDEFGKMITGQQ